MFCLYTFPLARPAQAKIQNLTAIWCIVKLIPWNVDNLSHLYVSSLKKLVMSILQKPKKFSVEVEDVNVWIKFKTTEKIEL